MFNISKNKAEKFARVWEAKKPDELSARGKMLFALAASLQKTRAAGPGRVQISPEARNRIKENFYVKYLNIINSRQAARKASPVEETQKEAPMPVQPKFKMALAYAAVGAIILAVALGYYFTRESAGPGGKGQIAMAAHLAVADGQVETWNGSEWQTIASGETLAGQSQIRTGEDSKTVLEFDEGSALRLDENTHVILQELNNQKIAVLQVAGETYSRVNKTSGLTYQVKTEDTETTALGTAFGIACENSNWVKKGEKKVIVKVLESKVKVKIIKNEETLEKEVGEGEELIVDLEKPIEDTAKKIPLSKEEIVKDNFYVWNREEDSKKEYPLGVMDDITGPEIAISEPLDGIKTELTRVAVKGTTEVGAKVWINGAEVENKDGAFEKIIDLKVGGNTVEVKAKDESGNPTFKKITITRTSPKPEYSLYLKGYADTDGMHLSWSVSGLEVPKGFKLVKSLEAYPTYPGDSAVFVDAASRSYVWKIADGKTYHFRICIYKDGGCGTYSNDLKLTTKTAGAAGKEVYGTLSLSGGIKTGTTVYLSWALSGSAPHGYKLAKSADPNPTYPGDEAVYVSSTDLKGSYVWDVKAPGTYHFRVCAYNGSGGCVFYSNDKEITVQ